MPQTALNIIKIFYINDNTQAFRDIRISRK